MAELRMLSEQEESNPLDLIEHLLFMRDMPYSRPCEEDLVAEMLAGWCAIKLWFQWQPEANMVHAYCLFDIRIPESRLKEIYPLLAMVNDSVHLGYFALSPEDNGVALRYSFLLHGLEGLSAEQIECFLDIAPQECDRFYPAFQSVLWGGKTAEDALQEAVFETIGEA